MRATRIEPPEETLVRAQNYRTEGSRNAETHYRKAPGGCRESRFNSQAPRRRQEGRGNA
jgi:hypothetical protein